MTLMERHRLWSVDTGFIQAVCLALAALMPLSSHGADVDAGALQQQIDRQQTFKLPRQGVPALPQPVSPKTSSVLKIVVHRFVVLGNTLVDEARIQSVLERHQGKELTFSDLETVVLEVADVFRLAGWTVQAYLPEQDVQDGVVRIQVVQARLGRVLIDGDVPAPATATSLKHIIQEHQPAGEFLSGKALDRALLIANDIAGVYVNGNLKEGEQQGETDVVLKTTPRQRYEGNASIDNTGSRGTGAQRLVASLNFNSVIGVGDTVSTQLIETKGSRYSRLGWTMPVGADGWRVGGNISHLDYRVLQFQESVAPTGTSDTYGIEANYPLLRSRSQNLYLSFAMDKKKFLNVSEGQAKSDYSSRLGSIGVYGNSFDEWGGGGANTGSLTWVDGNLNLDGSPNAADIATTTRTAGDFRKIRYALSRQQVLTSEWSVYGALSGQLSRSSKNLDSSEKFFLGGSAGVRAYPSSEAGGSKGVMANLELRWQMDPRWLLTGFYDIGHVELNPSKNLQDLTALNQYSLKGRGLALAWETTNGLALKLTLARRVGVNPAANPDTGHDLDGSFVKTRVWTAISLPF